MVFAGARAAGLAGLAVDGGRLLASAAQLPVAVFRGDEGQHYALRHVMIQGAWFAAAKQHAGNIDALLEHGPKAETLGPWALAHFQWSVAELAHCIEALAASPPGLRGALIGAWDWSKGQGDPMALTRVVRRRGPARGHKCFQKSSSELGSRRGRRSPRATASGRLKL